MKRVFLGMMGLWAKDRYGGKLNLCWGMKNEDEFPHNLALSRPNPPSQSLWKLDASGRALGLTLRADAAHAMPGPSIRLSPLEAL